MKSSSVKLLNAATATGLSESHEPRDAKRTFQATGFTTAGAGAATIIISGSNDGSNFITLGTITLTLGTSVTTDGFASDAPWRYIKANLSAVSGTGASVTVWMGA